MGYAALMLTRGPLPIAVVVAIESFIGMGVPACSSGEDGAADPIVVVKEWSASLAAAKCAITAPCCQSAGLPHDEATCYDSLVVVEQQAAEDALAAGASFDPSLAEQCLAAMQTMDCAQQGSFPSVCDLVLRADTPAGEPCRNDFECARPVEGHSFCSSSSTCSTRIPNGTSGSVCADEAITYLCGPGLVCQYPTCEVSAGSNCQNNYDCAPEDYCDTSSPDINLWSCLPRAQVGASCTVSECVTEAKCISDLCQLRLPATAECSLDEDCQNGHCDNLNGRCQFYDWCVAP